MNNFFAPSQWFSAQNGPRYVQLRQRIEEGIASGLFAPESSLPPEREIATLGDVSRVTVRKAFQELAERGAIIQRQGSGSFVAPAPRAKVEQSLSQLTSFTEDMARRGLHVTAQWLTRGLFMPSPDEALALGLGAGDKVARIDRLRLADGQPMAIERASLPVDILPDPEAVGASLYDHLMLRDMRPVRAVQKISARRVSGEDAIALGLNDGAAGLRIERRSYLASGRAAEFTRSLYRGDAYDFVAELRLAES